MCIDETNHSRSPSGDECGSRSKILVNPNILLLDLWFPKDSGIHTIGLHSLNPFKVMPVVHIYNFNVKDNTKLKIRPGWVDGLSLARGKWGLGGQDHCVDVHVCVREGRG